MSRRSFTIGGQVTKGGVTYRNLNCSANRDKGKAICSNAQSIGEAKLIRAVGTTLRESVAQHFDVFEKAFAEEWKAQAAALAAPKSGPADKLETEIRRVMAGVDRLAKARLHRRSSER